MTSLPEVSERLPGRSRLFEIGGDDFHRDPIHQSIEISQTIAAIALQQR